MLFVFVLQPLSVLEYLESLPAICNLTLRGDNQTPTFFSSCAKEKVELKKKKGITPLFPPPTSDTHTHTHNLPLPPHTHITITPHQEQQLHPYPQPAHPPFSPSSNPKTAISNRRRLRAQQPTISKDASQDAAAGNPHKRFLHVRRGNLLGIGCPPE